MKYYAKKEKGRRLELKFAKMIRDYGLDEDAKRMPRSGGFEHLKGDIWSSLPYQFELKNHERIQIWKFWEQAESQKRLNKKPVLVFSSNYRPVMVTMKAETFLDLLKELKDLKEMLEQLNDKQ